MTNQDIYTAIDPFSHLLEGIDVRALSADSYAVAYLEHLLAHKRYYLHVYAGVLNGLREYPTRLIDYGSGNGLLGIFAKYCGF